MTLQDELRNISAETEAKLPQGSRMRTFEILVTSNALGECIASAVCPVCNTQMGSIIDIGESSREYRAVDSVWSAMARWTREHVALCTRAK